MGCLKEKNILIGAQVFCWPKIINPLETRGFRTHFLLLTTPYGMFEIKKTQFLIEFLDRTQKITASRKKKFPSPQKSSPRD